MSEQTTTKDELNQFISDTWIAIGQVSIQLDQLVAQHQQATQQKLSLVQKMSELQKQKREIDDATPAWGE